MKSTFGVLVTFAFGLVGCGYIDGACWRRGEDGQGAGSGVGGGPLLPGVGGYGDVSAGPQSTGPDQEMPVECWVEGCKDGCDRQREEDLDICRKISAEQQDGCRQRAEDRAVECHQACGRLEKCYDKCDEKAAEGHKKCEAMEDGPGKAKCRQAVQEQLANCYRDCRRKKK